MSAATADVRALVELAALKVETRQRQPATSLIDRYQLDPTGYITQVLGWQPWSGTSDQPGQQEVIDAYMLAIRQQLERDRYESGEIGCDGLTCWQPGQIIQNRIRIGAGHSVGKTKLSSGLVNHFFDCFPPSIIYTFAPSWEQIHDLLWKEIKADRRGKGLPGRILDLALDRADNHFAKGRATSNAHGSGSERVQGQHGPFLMFVLDEAEGIADYVWDAIDSMTSGGVSIVLMLANPRTRTSRFHKARVLPNVASLRISCLWHPNVLQGREVVPGAVRREYVDMMIDTHCETVDAHDDDAHTFEVPWRRSPLGSSIFRPDAEFMFRVLGEAPANLSDTTLVPVGRFEAATQRVASSDRPHIARMGVDVARYGKDYGTLYVRHDGVVWRAGQFAQADTTDYAQRIITEAQRLKARGVTSLHVRVDGGGGFGGGVIDQLNRNLDFRQMFRDVQVQEVHFNGTPYDPKAYADLVTEMHDHAADALTALRVASPPTALEGDLTERMYRWVTKGGIAVKRLEAKDDVKKRLGRSPDDGDGFVLAVAPDHLFTVKPTGPTTMPVIVGAGGGKLQTTSSRTR